MPNEIRETFKFRTKNGNIFEYTPYVDSIHAPAGNYQLWSIINSKCNDQGLVSYEKFQEIMAWAEEDTRLDRERAMHYSSRHATFADSYARIKTAIMYMRPITEGMAKLDSSEQVSEVSVMLRP